MWILLVSICSDKVSYQCTNFFLKFYTSLYQFGYFVLLISNVPWVSFRCLVFRFFFEWNATLWCDRIGKGGARGGSRRWK